MNFAAPALAALSLVSAGAQAAFSQQDQPAPVVRQNPEIPTIRVESRFIPVALNVVDQQGAPVGGLTVDDFEVAEDGRPMKIAVFDRDSATPLAIVLTIDASESVFADEGLERQAARSFVKSLLRSQDRLDLMSFSDDVAEIVPFTNDAHRIDEGLSRLNHGQATAVYDAVFLAAQRLAQEKFAGAPRKVIVLITDGENTTRHGSYDTALEEAERAGAMVYSLIIVPVAADAGRNTGGEHALIQMARDTGGKYYYVENKHDLAPALQHVSDDLRTQYTVGYYAPQRGASLSGLRHIRIEMKDPALRSKYTLRYRTAYYADR